MAMVGTKDKDEIAGIPRDLAEAILYINDEYEKEDRDERDHKKPLWLKLENYFDGMQRRYWNAVARDWKILPGEEGDQTSHHYDKVINIYRAHAESIIAALSVKIPNTIFYPEDADVIEDVETAKACVKIKRLIERHNHGKLLLIKSLMYLFNTGFVAGYIYNRKSNQYGTYQKAEYGSQPTVITTVNLNCPECESNLDEVIFKGKRGKIEEEVRECPVCGYKGIPIEDEFTDLIPELTGYTNEPKTRTTIEVFSPLFVQVPFYARCQELIPYLRLKFEQHYSLLKAKYPKLHKYQDISTRPDIDAEDRGVSLNNKNLATVECLWVRPWGFNIHAEDDVIKRLKERYPDGFYAIIIDKQLVEIHNESLDDHWEIAINPMSEYLHGSPLGKPLAPIQDLKNEVIDLQIETFEHAIPETHARADVVDFKKYAESQAKPGMLYPAMSPSDGQPLSSAFHTIKTAALSEETDLFSKRLETEAQFVVGSFPSIYGGPATSGSKTAREYEQSRSMALQRLGNVWNIIQSWWAPLIGKSVKLYIHALRSSGQDEKFVEKERNVGFINIWIKQSELEGKVGRIEPDLEEELPQTANQLKDVVMQLMGLKDENLSAALFHPQNTPLLTKILGAPEFYIPNADSRDKQYAEFADLIQGIQVEVDIAVDDHPVERDVCNSYLISTAGQMLKKINAEGWEAIKQHGIEHHMAIPQKEAMMAGGPPPNPDQDPTADRAPIPEPPGQMPPEGMMPPSTEGQAPPNNMPQGVM